MYHYEVGIVELCISHTRPKVASSNFSLGQPSVPFFLKIMTCMHDHSCHPIVCRSRVSMHSQSKTHLAHVTDVLFGGFMGEVS